MSTPNGQPVIDVVSLPGAGALDGRIVSAQVSCELMKNQQPASPLNPTRDSLVAYDTLGRPMVFSIGTDGRLWLMRLDSEATSGWSVIDLTAGFSGYTTARAFDLSQDRKGRISIVAALSKEGADATDLFAAPLLSNDAQTDWSALATHARLIAGVDPGFAAERIRMGSSDDGPAPLTVAAGSIAGHKYYYQLTGFDQPATKLEFPENVSPDGDGLMDVSLGYAFGQRGVYFLYKIGDTETLECTTLADPLQGSVSYDYSPGNAHLPAGLQNLRYNCIATPTGSGTNAFTLSSDVYVGTDSGVYLFRDARAGSLQKVADGLADVHQVVVRDDGQNLSVWAMCSPSQLYYITGTKGPEYTWNAPILFSASAVHVAPIRSPARGANELFVVDQDASVTHWWQDPGTTLWQQRLLHVPQSSFLLDFESFTTHLHLEDGDGNPLVGQAVRVTASEWTYATGNGRLYSLDRDTPAEIPTDGMGNVTLVQMAASIHTPILHLQADCFGGTLNVYPNGKVLQGLQAVQTGADLTAARTQDGKPVLEGTYDDDTVSGVAANVSQLTGASGQYVTGARPAGTTFVTVEADGAKHDGVLQVAHLPANFAVGMQLKAGGWQPHTQASMAALSVGGALDDIEDWAGDALHWVETAFSDGIKLVEKGVTYLKDGVSFVIRKVEEGLQFVLSIAGKVLTIALKTLGSVLKALNWVLKLVGIDLKKILAWLGHLFGWDDIWDTHKVIAAVMRDAVEYAVRKADTEIDHWRASVDDALNGVGDRIRGLVLSPQLAGASVRGTAAAQRAGAPAGTSLNSPPANFSLYQVQHGGMLAGGAAVALPGSDPFSAFVNDVLTPAASALATALQRDLADLQRLWSDPSSTLQSAVTLAADLVDTILQPIRAVIDGFLTLLQDALGALASLLTDPLDLPFLSSFYEWVTDLLGEEEDLTVTNAVALLIAIPVTVVSKAATGHAPFANGTFGMDEPGFFDRMLGAPQPPAPSPAPARALAAAPAMRVAADMVATDRVPVMALASAPVPSMAKGTATAGTATAGAAAADDGESHAASGYSRYGGMIGAVASVAAGISNMISTTIETEPGTMNTADKVALGFNIVQCATTVPLPRKDQSDAAYGLKATAFGIWALYSALQWKLPKEPEVRGGALAGIDALLLVMALVADGLSHEEAGTWCVDIFSNAGGIVQGVSQAFKQGEGMVVGAGISYFGSLVAIILCMVADEDEIVQFVNVGG